MEGNGSLFANVVKQLDVAANLLNLNQEGFHMKVLIFLSMAFSFSIICISCSVNSASPEELNESLGFLPMQVGNYWKISTMNQTEIIDTVAINGETPFFFINFLNIFIF